MAGLERLLGESTPIAAVREQAARLLRSVAAPGRRVPPILILGETGTGKGLLASALHAAGPRAAGPFVDVNCAAIPETLLEAELFGHERGAFTDAGRAKEGLFQAAGGGTIFLDEVGLMPVGLQAKLLKVIEERAVRRLGGTRNEATDVAVVAATSEDLTAAVRDGRFRADLYHRLAVVTLGLPPLRARGDDVLLLAEDFLARIREDYGLAALALTDDARAALRVHPWPGNVRELANVLERAALLADEPTLTAARLGLPAADAPSAPASGETAADAEAESERRVVLDVLRATDWNFTRAAARLGLPRNTLRYRVERLGLTPEGGAERRRGGRPPTTARPVVTDERPTPAPATREARRVTLLRLRLLPTAAGGWETGRTLEDSAGKVRSFGGRIEEVGEDGLLATFGLEPDEDAPRRAAYAALAVRTQAARARGAGSAGPDAVVALHSDVLPVTHEEGVIQVDAAALKEAQRALESLLAAAAPDTVVASAAAGRFLARRFDLLPLEGPAAPAGACRVIRQAEVGRSRFVGRERELRLLGECWELARAGQGQLVLVVGEPGIGKSRLVHEFRRRVGRGAAWIEGQALSFGRAMPFHPVIDMVRRVGRIDDADPEAVVVDKLARGLARLGADVERALPFMRYLLSLDPGDPAVRTMDPRRRHAAIVETTHALLERAAVQHPHVVVLEDVHWCDPATEDWIARLADRLADSRILLVLTCRPGYRPQGATSHTAIALATLSGEESLRIAGGLLGVEELPGGLPALLVGKAEGNPFFIEELVRALEEQGVVRREGERVVLTASLEAVTLPDTVEEVVLSRTHRLDERLRQVLEVAAVIGRNVPFPLLRAVTGRPEEALAADLRRLHAADFLYEARVFPDVEYTFKHALTQDVAYARVAPDDRRALHARIVGALETLHRDRLDEHVERLAYHALRGELWPRAVAYARQAGAKAFDRSANREAVASFDQALAALEHLPRDPEFLADAIDIRLAIRSALLQLAEIPRIARDLREAEALATALGDRRRLAWVWTYTTIAHLFDGDPVQAMAVGERALELAETVGDVGLRASARTPLAHACRERGDFRRALALFDEAIEALSGDLVRERLGQAMPPSFYARSMAAFCRAEVGEFAEAARLATEAATQTRTLDLPFGLALAQTALGHTYLVEGRLDDALAALAPALDVIEARALPTWWPWTASLRGYALALSGRVDEGRALLERAVARAEALPFLFGHSQWVAWLAHASLLAGQVEEARRLGERALALSRRRGERSYEGWTLHILGEVEARRGPEAAPAARALQRQALALAEELGMRPLATRCRA